MDGAEGDNLSNSLFLRVLRSKFKDVWLRAEAELLFVCVPAPGCFDFPGHGITREVAESHVLRESKMFVGRYEALNGRQVTMEGNKMATMGEDWPAPRDCRVLFEELFYNKAWQKFRVVCIDTALVGGKPPGADKDVPKLPKLTHRTLRNSKVYLEAFPENEIVLRKIRQYCETFVSSYYVIKGFEHHAHDKVKGLVAKAMDDLLCTNKLFRQFHYEDRNLDALSQVVENYMFEVLHKKLFASMCDIHRDEDDNLHELAAASRDAIKLSQMGTGEAFQADDLPLAVATLATLEERVTPLEKLLCFKETIDAVSSDLAAFREKQTDERVRALDASQGSLVTSDELLPLLVFVIVRSSVTHLLASVAYAESFTFFNVQTSELGFCLTSVQAALTLLLRSQLLRRNRRDRFPDSRFNASDEKKGRKSASTRRSAGAAPPTILPRTISVPSGAIRVVSSFFVF
jgi:hypothetical protein